MHAAHAPVGGDPADRREHEHARAGERHEPPDSRHTGHHGSHDQGVRAEPHELRRHRQHLGEPLDDGRGRHQLAGAGGEVHRMVPGHGVGREDDQCGGDENWQRRPGTLVAWERQPDGERHGDGESEPAAERRAAGNDEKAPEEGATRGQDAAGPCVVGQIRDQREDEGGEEHLPVDRVPLQRPGQRRTGSPGERAPARAERTDAQPARRHVDEHRAQQMRAEDGAECGSGLRSERGHQAEGRRVEHGEEVARPDLRQERNAIHRDQVVEVIEVVGRGTTRRAAGARRAPPPRAAAAATAQRPVAGSAGAPSTRAAPVPWLSGVPQIVGGCGHPGELGSPPSVPQSSPPPPLGQLLRGATFHYVRLLGNGHRALREVEAALGATPTDRVLDFACGAGGFCQAVPGEYLGIDLSANSVAFARWRWGSPRRRFEVMPLEALPDEPRFDKAMARELRAPPVGCRGGRRPGPDRPPDAEPHRGGRSGPGRLQSPSRRS